MSVTAVPLQPVKTSHKLWLWLGILVAVLGAFGLAWVGTRAPVVASYSDTEFLAWHKGRSGIQTTASGLQYEVLAPGEGAVIADGDGVSLTVQGELRNGTEFQPKVPMRMQVGQPMFPGFTEGVKLMRKGSRYRFWLPAELGMPAQPGQENELVGKLLVFEVEIQEVVPAAIIRQMQQQQEQMMLQQGAPGAGPGPETGEPKQ